MTANRDLAADHNVSLHPAFIINTRNHMNPIELIELENIDVEPNVRILRRVRNCRTF